MLVKGATDVSEVILESIGLQLICPGKYGSDDPKVFLIPIYECISS